MTKETKELIIGFIVVVTIVFIFGFTIGRTTVPTPEEKKIFTKGYLLTRYPVAGEDRHLYVIDFQFDNVEEVIDWINKYEAIRER